MRCRIACSLLYKHFLMVILLITQMVFAFVSIQICVGRINMGRHSFNALRQLETRTGFYITTEKPIDNAISKQLQDIHSISQVGECYLMIDNCIYRCLIYDDTITNLVSFTLSEGKWLSEVSTSDTAPIVCLGRDFHLGEQVKASLYGQEYTFPITIEGIIDDSPFIYQQSIGGSYIKCSDLYAYGQQQIDAMPILLTDYRLLSYITENDVYWQGSTLILTEDNTHYDENKAILAEQGYVVDISDLFNNERKEISAQLNSMAPYIIMTFLLSLAGLIGMGLLVLYTNTKQFSIYLIVGASRRDIRLISIWCTLIPSVLASLITSLVLFILFQMHDVNLSILWESSNVFALLISICVNVVLPVVAMQIFLRALSPIRLFHRIL